MSRSTLAEPSALGLRKMKLLEGVSRTALEELARQCRWRRFEARQRIFSRETKDQDVYLIVSGRVRIAAFSAGGQQVTYRELPEGSWFGDLSAIDGQARSADVDALEDTLLAAMAPAVFRRLLHEHPVVCDRMLHRLVTLIRDLSERVFDFSTLGVQNRVHAELLRLAREAGVSANMARIEPAPKHADIASRVATYREQVTRELSALGKQGLLLRAGSALVVPDVRRLEQIVGEVRQSA